jgi:hypothetical protein
VRRSAVDFAWIGPTQTVASFVMLGFVNSVVVRLYPRGLWGGALLVPALAALELSNLHSRTPRPAPKLSRTCAC